MSPTVVTFHAGGWVPLNGEPSEPPPAPNVGPSVPTGLSIVSAGTTSLAVSWAASTDTDGTVVGYEVRVNGALQGTTTGLAYTATGLTAATLYTVAVRALDDDGAASADLIGTGTTATDVPPITTVTHGREITVANTGHTAYFDATLGRTVVDSDLTIHTTKVNLSSLASVGGTISKRWFKAGFTDDLNGNVTLVACQIHSSTSGVVSNGSGILTLNWCTLDNPTGAYDNAIAFRNYTAYRCRIGGGSDGVKANGGASLIECYVRVKGQASDDHHDGAQSEGSATGPNFVQRCNIDIRPTNALGLMNAPLFCADGATGLQTWEDNLLAGGAYGIRAHEAGTYAIQGNDVIQGTYENGAFTYANRLPVHFTWGPRPNRIVTAAGVFVSNIPAPT